MNLKTNQKGFTIVELLIVVIVIAILAAISIVAYTGITNRANRSAAMEAANAVKSVVTTYQGANGGYPATKALMVSGGADPIAKLPCDITFKGSAPASSDASPKTVMVQSHTTSSVITGFTITYYDYVDGSTATMLVGTQGGTAATLGNSCT